ncbi:MAG: glycosyltransferase [Brumimicrobium sp.]|nr:glycosyltransferase [Brumimicrobium sp.]
MLSILIPVYNHNCVRLVKDLHSQGMMLNIPFEIIVLDDISSLFLEENDAINELENARFIGAKEHLGRAKIRNELSRMATYENLLFIDSDAQVDHSDFLKNYLQHLSKADVLVGGMKYALTPPMNNVLRWYYGSKREDLPEKIRNQHPYRSIISFNILIKKHVFSNYPFDETNIEVTSSYGHEDTLLGLIYKRHAVSILHIDNQLIHDYKETNEGFLRNSLIAVEKYVRFQKFREKEVVSQIKIFKIFELSKKMGLLRVFDFLYKRNKEKMRANLLSQHPSLKTFDFYRLYYLAHFYLNNTDLLEK